MFRCMGLLAVAFLFTACAEPSAPLADAALDDAVRIEEGSAEALGLIAFLNDGDLATFALLDIDVGLDRRAAAAIVHYRDGADGEFGTADDQLYGSIAQVDDQYYVGNSALNLIRDFAVEAGYVAQGPDDILGTWDGVTFTVAEADAVLDAANTWSGQVLDVDVELDSRAVNSVVSARPIPSVEHLAGLYYVGKSALNKLKDAAVDSDADSPESVFAADLRDALVDTYANMGADIEAMGGSGLADAQDAVSADGVWLLEDPEEDPYGYSFATTDVFAHVDPIFEGSDNVWFGAYHRATGELIEVYSFN